QRGSFPSQQHHLSLDPSQNDSNGFDVCLHQTELIDSRLCPEKPPFLRSKDEACPFRRCEMSLPQPSIPPEAFPILPNGHSAQLSSLSEFQLLYPPNLSS